MSPPRVLITGASGFVGAHAVSQFAEYGADVVTVSRTARETEYRAEFPRVVNLLQSLDEVTALLRDVRPTHIAHFSGQPSAEISVDNPYETFQSNTRSSLLFLEALRCHREFDIQRLLLIGSAHEVVHPGEPVVVQEESPVLSLNSATPYALSKVIQLCIAEQYRRLYHVPVTVARTFNLVGPGVRGGLFLQLIRQAQAIRNGQSLPVFTVRNASTSIDVLDVRDAVEAYWELLMVPDLNDLVVHVCSGTTVSIRDMIEGFQSVLGVPVTITETYPRPLGARIAASPTKLSQYTGWSRKISLIHSIEDALKSVESRTEGNP